VPWLLLVLALGLAGCAPSGAGSAGAGGSGGGPPVNATPSVGDAARGRTLFTTKVCIGCHQVSGQVSGGATGPDLRGFASRPLIAGAVPNTPENVWRWLENSPRVKPGTLMPRTPVTAQELDDLTAYMLSLQ
jgi:cytochrome c oxidase subunit 2